MKRTTAAAVLAAAALLLTGCGSEDDGNPCGTQTIVFVEADGTYHCGTETGNTVPEYDIDIKVKNRAQSKPGSPVKWVKPPASKAPAPAKPVTPPKPGR